MRRNFARSSTVRPTLRTSANKSPIENFGVTNSLYAEVIVYAATSLMVGQYTERTRQVEHTRPAGKHRNKNSRVKIAQ